MLLSPPFWRWYHFFFVTAVTCVLLWNVCIPPCTSPPTQPGLKRKTEERASVIKDGHCSGTPLALWTVANKTLKGLSTIEPDSVLGYSIPCCVCLRWVWVFGHHQTIHCCARGHWASRFNLCFSLAHRYREIHIQKIQSQPAVNTVLLIKEAGLFRFCKCSF